MEQDTKTRLSNVLYTLGLIQVSGKDNLDRLLGCMQMLETVLEEKDDDEQDPAER